LQLLLKTLNPIYSVQARLQLLLKTHNPIYSVQARLQLLLKTHNPIYSVQARLQLLLKILNPIYSVQARLQLLLKTAQHQVAFEGLDQNYVFNVSTPSFQAPSEVLPTTALCEAAFQEVAQPHLADLPISITAGPAGGAFHGGAAQGGCSRGHTYLINNMIPQWHSARRRFRRWLIRISSTSVHLMSGAVGGASRGGSAQGGAGGLHDPAARLGGPHPGGGDGPGSRREGVWRGRQLQGLQGTPCLQLPFLLELLFAGLAGLHPTTMGLELKVAWQC